MVYISVCVTLYYLKIPLAVDTPLTLKECLPTMWLYTACTLGANIGYIVHNKPELCIATGPKYVVSTHLLLYCYGTNIAYAESVYTDFFLLPQLRVNTVHP